MTQSQFENQAAGSIMWTWPIEVAVPTINTFVEILFPVPTQPLLPTWTQSAINLWSSFVGHVKNWFADSEFEDYDSAEEFLEALDEAIEYAAEQCGITAEWPLTDYPYTPPVVPEGE